MARSLPGAGPARDLAAGRLVLERLDKLFEQRADIVLETVYKPIVDEWEVYASSDEGLSLLEEWPS